MTLNLIAQCTACQVTLLYISKLIFEKLRDIHSKLFCLKQEVDKMKKGVLLAFLAVLIQGKFYLFILA